MLVTTMRNASMSKVVGNTSISLKWKVNYIYDSRIGCALLGFLSELFWGVRDVGPDQCPDGLHRPRHHGEPMAMNLLRAGLALVVWNRSEAKCAGCRSSGGDNGAQPPMTCSPGARRWC